MYFELLSILCSFNFLKARSWYEVNQDLLKSFKNEFQLDLVNEVAIDLFGSWLIWELGKQSLAWMTVSESLSSLSN